MKTLFAASLTGLALLTGSALAADLPPAPQVYKAPPVMAPAYSWTGCYVNGGFGYGGGLFGGGAGANAAAAGGAANAHVQKQSQVLAVADMRTSSVIVTASKDLMQEIAGMIDKLDVSSTRDQQVYTYQLRNGADPYEAQQVLQAMFGGNSTTSRGGTSSSSSSSSLLQNRITESGQNMTVPGTTSSSGVGTSGGGGAGGGGRTF